MYKFHQSSSSLKVFGHKEIAFFLFFLYNKVFIYKHALRKADDINFRFSGIFVNAKQKISFFMFIVCHFLPPTPFPLQFSIPKLFFKSIKKQYYFDFMFYLYFSILTFSSYLSFLQSTKYILWS